MTEAVLLLHGLGRTRRSMRPLQRRLARTGFVVRNPGYPSRHRAPEDLVPGIGELLERAGTGADRLHLVGHSLGAILIRACLERQIPERLGRVVMLAPPNHGSEIADMVGGWRIVQALAGPAVRQLGTVPDSLPNRLPAPRYEVGVIAGTGTVNPIGSLIIPGANDGIVSVASTRLEGMADFLEVRRSHAFMMRAPEVAAQVEYFLRHGRFFRESAVARGHPGDEYGEREGRGTVR